MADKRTCFIISPIGERDSDARKHADNLVKRIIIPALANINFDIIRSDQSFANMRITDEIVQLIKNAELCIVDSSNYNPNVMYELGRRHETGRPVILLRPGSQNIIFDLNDIKQIEYNLDDVDMVIECQSSIRGFLIEFEKQGFISADSSASIDNISTSISRVERRIDDIFKMMGQRSTISESKDNSISSNVTQIIKSLGTSRAMIYCIQNEMVRESEEIFKLIEPKISPPLTHFYLARIASIGSRSALTRVELEVLPLLSQHNIEDSKTIISNYVSANYVFDTEAKAISIIKPIILEDFLNARREELNAEDKAFLINQLGRLHSGTNDLSTALKYYEDAIMLNPSEPAYLYNAASVALDQENMEKTILYTDKLKSMYDESATPKDHNHLSLIYRVYVNASRHSDALSVLEQIKDINPLLANVLAMER